MTGSHPALPAPDEVLKIGILRSNALGDFIVTLPAIHSLKRHFSKAAFTLFGNLWHKEFLEEQDDSGKRTPIDQVIVIPVIKGLREEAGKNEEQEIMDTFYSFVQKEQYDLMISFQGKGDASAPFLSRSKARYTLGLYDGSLSVISPDRILEYFYYQSEVIRFLELVAQIGVPATTLEPSLRLLDKDYDEAKTFLAAHEVGENYVVVHPGSNDSRRMWSEEKWAQVCYLLKNEGLDIILSGTAPEADYTAAIIQKSKVHCIHAAGRLSLGGVAALYSLSRAVIAVDTGTLHLAIAAQASTVGLYWAPNVINWSPLYRKKHRPVISWELRCPHCGIVPNTPYPFEPISEACDHRFSFIESITVQEVVNTTMQLIQYNEYQG